MFVPFPKCGLEHALTNRTPETKILIRIGALVPVHPRRDPRGETTPLSCFPFFTLLLLRAPFVPRRRAIKTLPTTRKT